MCVSLQCLVELGAALKGRKPVVMLIGAAGADGSFVSQKGMVNNLCFSMDVQQAEASVPADKERILKEIEASEGGYGALNRMGIGAISGAVYAMDQRALLKAVAGDTAPLAALQSTKELDEAMRGAAAAGFLEPLRALLARKVPVESATRNGCTPLLLACQGGHEHCARALIEAGAAVDAVENKQWTALMFAAQGGHERCALELLKAGAAVDATDEDGWTALMQACAGGHEQ